MQKVRKVPQRQCVGCREMKNKKDLIRVVRSPEGEISLDFKGKKPGRGAFETAIPAEVYDQLEQQMEVGGDG